MYVIQYNLFGATSKLISVLAIKKLAPIRFPHSRMTIPTQNEAAAMKNKLFDSTTDAITNNITTNAVSTPANAIFFAFTCMRTNRLPYTHTLYPDTINHSINYQYHKTDAHIHTLCFDTSGL